MQDVDAWFTQNQRGHVPLKGLGEDIDFDAVKAKVAETYPHFLELTMADNPPMSPLFIFEEDKQPWTSFFSRQRRAVVFAFSDVKDAVECRLVI